MLLFIIVIIIFNSIDTDITLKKNLALLMRHKQNRNNEIIFRASGK